jgi:hypothetical protein
MNTPNALFLLGLVFLTFACFSILRVQNTNNAKLVLQHISSLIKQNIKPKYFYEIGDSCIQIVAYITEDSNKDIKYLIIPDIIKIILVFSLGIIHINIYVKLIMSKILATQIVHSGLPFDKAISFLSSPASSRERFFKTCPLMSYTLSF